MIQGKVVKLSDSVYDSTSVAALGVAAHECGHVIQHHEEYLPLRLRTLLVPAANFGSKAGIPIILLGILFGYNYVLGTDWYLGICTGSSVPACNITCRVQCIQQGIGMSGTVWDSGKVMKEQSAKVLRCSSAYL